MEFEYEFRREDELYRARQFLRRYRAAAGSFGRSGYGWIAMGAFIALALAIAFGVIGLGGVAAGLLTMLVWLICRQRWTLERAVGDGNSPIYGRKRCRADETGISIESEYVRNEFGWPAICEIEDSPQYLSFYVDASRGQVIPKKSFASQEQLRQFREELRRHATAARFVETTATSPGPVAGPRRFFALVTVLAAGLAVYVFLWWPMPGLFAPREAARLTVAIDRTEAVDRAIVVLGRVTNPSRKDLQVVSLGLQFFDKENQFIDQCTVFTLGLLVRAGSTENFKAGCAVRDAATPERGDAILASTPKSYARIEVKLGRTLAADGFPMLRGDD